MPSVSRTVSVDATIDVNLDDFEDEVIVEEVFFRGLAEQIIARHRKERGIKNFDVRAAAATIMGDLTARRPMQARNDFLALLRDLAGAQLIDAWIALSEGRQADAICLLDRVVEPSQAAGDYQPQEPEPLLP